MIGLKIVFWWMVIGTFFRMVSLSVDHPRKLKKPITIEDDLIQFIITVVVCVILWYYCWKVQ